MMKNMKRGLAAALAVMLCLSLAACKGKDFDAKGYVKSVLDAHYHGAVSYTHLVHFFLREKSVS